jgi:hypothetical protein
MGEDNPTTSEMRARQGERRETEKQLAEETGEHEAAQHRRRAAKSAYLERKLAERERSERGA